MSTTPDTLTLRLQAGPLEDIPLGVIRVSADEGRIVYLNARARAILETTPGTPLLSLPFTDESRETLARQMERRWQDQTGGFYNLDLRRERSATVLRLRVTSVPEYDATDRVLGSIAFIEDTTMEHANLAIHEAIGDAKACQPLLDALHDCLRNVIPFDGMLVSLVSEDRTSIRVLYRRPSPEAVSAPAWRWWPMPEYIGADLGQLKVARENDIAAMFKTDPYSRLAQEDKSTGLWLAEGWRQMLRRPVRRDGKLAAILTLLRCDERRFSDDEVRRAEHLPLVEAVNMALALDERCALEDELALVAEMGRQADSLKAVASVLVERLRLYKSWHHVSLFRVDRDRQRVVLVEQCGAVGTALEEGHSFALADPPFGEVAQSAKPMLRGRRAADSRETDCLAKAQSRMCLPVPGESVRWILNVESLSENEFAPHEENAVKRLLVVAGLVLDRTLAMEFNEAVRESVADAVIQTSADGQIQWINGSGEALLGRSRADLVGVHLSTLIVAPPDEPDAAGYASRMAAATGLVPGEARLRAADGDAIPVLLSCASLPSQIGGRVYVASDLRHRQEVQRIDALRQMFRQVASEIRVPLALATSFLGELGNRAVDDDVVPQTLRQLARADLSLERVVRLASEQPGEELPMQALLLDDFARDLVDSLPRAQQEIVRVVVGDEARPVVGSLRELQFCASSLLAFLLRMRSQRDLVRIRVDAAASRPRLCFELADRDTLDGSGTRLEARSEQEREFALAEPVLQALMQRMRGSFEIQQRDGLSLRLLLTPAEAA